jgi:hypothetical protein
MVNFLTDPTRKPHMTTDRLSQVCGGGKSTLSAKFRIIQDRLRLAGPMAPEYCRRDLLANNPLAWMVKVNGFIVLAICGAIEASEGNSFLRAPFGRPIPANLACRSALAVCKKTSPSVSTSCRGYVGQRAFSGSRALLNSWQLVGI